MTWKVFAVCVAVWATAVPATVLAQLPVQAAQAELSIPFGAASGQIATAADLLLFINSERVDASFAIPRKNIRNVSVSNDVITVETVEPVNGLKALSFRIVSGDANQISRWAQAEGAGTMTAGSARSSGSGRSAQAAASDIEQSYQARHNHRITGGCTGRLIIRSNVISYDSVDEIGHSRQWQMQEIKEFKRRNPYKISIVPFVGQNYDLELVGEGMSGAEYQQVTESITTARKP
jgi:hypothetical protein